MARITEEAKGASRARLLDAAAAEFARQGLAAANINHISVMAGLGKGTVYNYFASKEALFLAVVQEACERVAHRSDQVPASAPTRDRLRAAVASDVEWARNNEAFARVLVRGSLAGDPRTPARIEAAAAPFISHVAGILADGVDRGEVRGDVPVGELALLFTGLVKLALVHNWGTEGAWPESADIPDLVVRQFLEGAALTRAERRPG
jgi:TetR/AcrR family fatty acid metabolism transcriptional regulator